MAKSGKPFGEATIIISNRKDVPESLLSRFSKEEDGSYRLTTSAPNVRDCGKHFKVHGEYIPREVVKGLQFPQRVAI